MSKCKHSTWTLDIENKKVICSYCNASLDPFTILREVRTQHNEVAHLMENIKSLTNKGIREIYCKCANCGTNTQIFKMRVQKRD